VGPLLAVLNITADTSMANVPTIVLLYNGSVALWFNCGRQRINAGFNHVYGLCCFVDYFLSVYFSFGMSRV